MNAWFVKTFFLFKLFGEIFFKVKTLIFVMPPFQQKLLRSFGFDFNILKA